MVKLYLRFKGINSLLFMLAFSLATIVKAQGQNVTGTVTDADDGSGIPGVNIVEKGTANGTITDLDGNYSISVSSGATLVFSYVGYLAQEVVVGAQSTIDISLVPDVTQLSEVVVIGYGTVKKSDLTGSVTSVGEEDFNKGVFSSPDQMLQGKAAGVQVFNNDGTPGGGSTVRIRGNSSVRTGNQPLYVVDGVFIDNNSTKPDPGEVGGSGSGSGNSGTNNPLNFLNPSDIASMEILKDASATAIYGSRGANGVVLITTKRGKSGAPKVDFGASVGVSSMMRELSVLNAGQYRQALNDYGIAGGDFGGSSDAMDEITRTGITQNYNMSITGGSEKGSYRVSAGYLDQQGILENSGLTKYTASINGSYKVLNNDILTIDFNLLAAQNEEEIAPVTNNAGFTGDVVAQALQWNPTRDLRLPNGDFDIELGSTTINPAAYLAAYRDNARITSVLASVAPSLKITDNLTYKFQVSLKRDVGVRDTEIKGFINVQGVEGRGWANYGTLESTTQQYTHTLNYTAPISNSIDLNAVVGYEYFQLSKKTLNFGAKDFLIDELLYTDILNNSTQASRTIVTETDPISKLQSFFGRAIVTVNDKLSVTATLRADGSSKFGTNNRYGIFPSFAAGYNLTDALSLGFVDNLKLRASWGQTGNQEFPPGASQERYELIDNTELSGLENVPNPDLKWETSTTINVGVDFAIFNARVTGSLEYFDKTTEDLLFNFAAIQPAPASRYWDNLDGKLKNSGFEMTLDWLAVEQGDLQVNIGGNISFLTNELTDYTGPTVLTGELSGQGISGTTVQRIANDQPVNVFFTRDWRGLDENGFDDLVDGGNSNFFIGDPNPDVLLGLNGSLSYGKLDFVMNFAGAFGHEVYNNTANTVIPIGNLGTRNIAEDLIKGSVMEDRANSIKASSRYLEKGNYIKMTNFSLGYSFGNVGSTIKNLRVALTGQNLFVITDYSGFDPEVNTDKSQNDVPSFGIEYTPYPTPRTFLLNVNFSF